MKARLTDRPATNYGSLPSGDPRGRSLKETGGERWPWSAELLAEEKRKAA